MYIPMVEEDGRVWGLHPLLHFGLVLGICKVFNNIFVNITGDAGWGSHRGWCLRGPWKASTEGRHCLVTWSSPSSPYPHGSGGYHAFGFANPLSSEAYHCLLA